MKKVTNQVLLVAVLSFILNGCVPSPSPTATPTALMPTKASPTATAPETDDSTSNLWQPTTGTSGSVILQENNPLPKTRLASKQSGDLDDNRIASFWHGLWEYDPVSHLLKETLHLGVKRYRIAINSGDQDKVDWTKSEFSVDPSHDEFITNLANNGIQITYFLSFWDKATWPGGVGASCPRFKTEEEIERYLEFVRFIVGHFKDRVQIYEIYNEPDNTACPQWIEVEDYINLVRRAVPVIREEYPDAKIQVGGTTGLSNPDSQDYLFSILESDIMPLVDIVSWHPFYGNSPETDAGYYFAYPSIVQKIKDTATSYGFTGEYAAEEMNWRPSSDRSNDQPSPYSELESAKYQIRGIIMHLGMDVIAGNLRIPSDPPPLPNHYVETTFAVRNLSTLMVGWKPENLFAIDSEESNIKHYGFTSTNGDRLLAIWVDNAAVDDYPGLNATLTIENMSAQNVIGIDVLNGFQQELIVEEEDGNLIIPDLLIKDFPIIIKFINVGLVEDIPEQSPIRTITIEPTPSVKSFSIIYDDDGSRDGTVALLYLLSEPMVSIKAVNISYGEAHPQVYIQHIGRMLEAVGYQDIPLGAGQDAPIGNGTPFPNWLRQLCDNFWNYSLPNADKTYPVQNAPELMVSAINQASEPVTIFMSGTFTTLAQALRLDPGIREHIAAVYIMGGAVYVPGNITNLIPDSNNKVAEWNIISDPQAAEEVFNAGLDMYLIPLDATNKVLFNQDDIQPWHDGDQKAKFSAELYDIMFNEYGWEQAEIFDLGAAVIMVEPEACEFQPLHLDIITNEGFNLGQTVVDPGSEPNIKVCLDPDAELIMQVLHDSFSSPRNASGTPSIDPIIGTWTGAVFNNDFEMQISVIIEDACQINQKCGHFDITTVSCSGSLTWVGMDGDMYQFEVSEKTEACGEGKDFLFPQPDGTLMYISRGNYGETTGILQIEP